MFVVGLNVLCILYVSLFLYLALKFIHLIHVFSHVCMYVCMSVCLYVCVHVRYTITSESLDVEIYFAHPVHLEEIHVMFVNVEVTYRAAIITTVP